MVTSLARQAVIIKSGNDTSILTGNYEWAYAAGFLIGQMKIPFSEEEKNDIDIKKLHKKLLAEMEGKILEDIRMKRLYRMVRLYDPLEEWDEQMQELFQTGFAEKYPWDLYHQ